MITPAQAIKVFFYGGLLLEGAYRVWARGDGRDHLKGLVWALARSHATDAVLGRDGLVTGNWGPLRVIARMEQAGFGRANRTTIFSVFGGEQPAYFVTLRPASANPFEGALTARERLVGDAAFDEIFEVSGSAERVAALFDAPTRVRLTRLHRIGRVSLDRGVLRLAMTHDPAPPTSLDDLLRALREVGEHMMDRRALLGRLLDNARSDPEPPVRSNNLRVLLHEHAWRDQTEDLLVLACSDADPEVRLLAGRQLGEQGFPVLRELAEGEASWAAPAVMALQENLPLSRAPAIIERDLARGGIDVASACITVLGRYGGPEQVDVLVPLLAASPDVAVLAAHALGELCASAAERRLIAALNAESAALRVAAAAALGKWASVGAVPALREASERYGDPEFRRTAEHAIAAIQARVPGDAAGRVSLPEKTVAAGHVSMGVMEKGDGG